MVNYKRISLVHSPLDLTAVAIPNTGSIAPLGLISLATYISLKIPDLEINIIDGDLLGLDETKKSIKSSNSDIVGIGVQACESYASALELARVAKETGAIVVLGGEQSTIRARQILHRRSFIDLIIRGQGERGLELLLKGERSEQIPGLVYRTEKRLPTNLSTNSSIMENPTRRLRLRNLPIPDRRFVEQKRYALEFQKTLESQLTDLESFVTIRTQDGCMKAIKDGVCTFCVRDDLMQASLRTPAEFWNEVIYLQDLGVDYAWDIAPSFSSVSTKYLQALAKTKPQTASMRFRIYARADDLAMEDKTKALSDMGVENVLVGFDSGNQACLDSANKKTTLEQHRQAARNLRKYGISTYSGFILGYLVETDESMQDTLNHACELRDIIGERNYRIVTCSKMQLYPGSGEWNVYLRANPQARLRYGEADLIDMRQLTEEYFREFLHIDPAKADEIAEQIRALSPIKSGKDMKKGMVH